MSAINTVARSSSRGLPKVPDVETVPCPKSKKGFNHSLKASPNYMFNCIYCRKTWADLDAEVRPTENSESVVRVEASPVESHVKPGQVWADNDKRQVGRTVQVESLEHTDGKSYANVKVLTDRDTGLSVTAVGRSFRVRLDRFYPNSTGFRLMEDV